MLLNQLNKLNRPLMEGFNNAIHTFDATEMKIADIVEVLANSGYVHDINEFLDTVIYGGFIEQSYQHYYWIASTDGTECAIGKIYVRLNKDGKIAGEFGMNDAPEGLTQQEAEEFLHQQRPKDEA